MGFNTFTFLFTRTWRYAEGHRRKLVGYYLLFTLSVGVVLLEPYIFGRMLNAFQDGSLTTKNFLSYLVLYFSLSLVVWVFHAPARLMEIDVAFSARSTFRQKLFDALMELPLKWHKDHLSGDSIDKVTKGSLSLHQFVSYDFEVYSMLLRFIGALLVLVIYMPVAGIIVVGGVCLTGCVVLWFDRKLGDQYNELNTLDNRVASLMFEYVSNIVTIITLRLEGRVSKHISAAMQKVLLYHPYTSGS